MKQYDWPAWNRRMNSFSGKWALERWFLMYLHEQQNVDALALAVKARLAAEGRHAEVRIQSIWVDGTPQAEFSPKGHSPRSKQPQCELADLLLCVRWESPSGLLQREQAMLIQAKVASKYNKLPGGKSTRKERLLFENCNRHKNITLYPGVNRENPIGAYQLGSSADSKSYGLHDCASFLLMAKSAWHSFTGAVGPLQVGWPLDKAKTEIRPPDSYLDAVIAMVSGPAPTLGREVKTGASAIHCVWTKMVNDLRGRYEEIKMTGYDEQARVTTATSMGSAFQFICSRLDKDKKFEDFVSNVKKHFLFFAPSFYLFTEHDWLIARVYRHRMISRRLDLEFEIMAILRVSDWFQFNPWENASGPPSNHDDFDEGDGVGPHIFTQVITIRGVEESYQSD
ncbi:hypothetical protein [Pseudomonas siliginis]|uniref:hypothetical protein n=1 Tax=Pseudomonas siliginis TaxID=2842346 RepID=UPI0020934062|nr:hypothetical protein [Pseudomonas siliginis]UST88446.1 hypothetical protein NF678_16615 [Pseudomonas siliginis]